jgi:spore coat polysaccharide biosynthesis predicted glycosyltransferase SpsG/L-amino acid N-acyltransferase YncA
MARRAFFSFAFGPSIGLGHAVRSAALAEALKVDGWRCGAPAGVPALVAHAFEAGGEAEAELLVLDSYAPDTALVARCRARGARVLQIHDGGDTPVLGDLVLNPNADAPADGTGLSGPRYALVRGAFPARRPLAASPAERRGLERVLVAPGATDVGGVCRALAARRGRRFTFVLSRLAADFVEVERRVAGGPHRLVGDAGAEALADLMLEHDFAIGNAGGGSWERCTLGLPSISLVMAENQRGNAQALAARGATLLAGAAAEIENLLDGADLPSLSRKAFAVTDGLGACRTALALSPERISLRPAAAADEARTYQWQQHPETRRYARNPAIPSPQEHAAWFAAKLADHRSVFEIVLHEGREAGALRLDYRETRQQRPCYEISIYVDPALHGRGIGGAALRAARRLTPFAWRKAFVDERNTASVSLFARAGFRKDGAFLYDPPSC